MKRLILFSIGILVTGLACGLVNNIKQTTGQGESDMTRVADLWSDVPPMDGMTASQ